MGGWKQTLTATNGLIFFLFLGLGTVIFAGLASATEIRVPPMTVKSGEILEVPIMIDRVDNLAGVKLVVKYDPKILKFKKAKRTRQTDSLMYIVNDKKPGLLIIVMAGARGIKGKDFPIIILRFETKGNLKGNHTTKLAITDVQLMSDKLKSFKCKVVTHRITVLAPKKAGGAVNRPE